MSRSPPELLLEKRIEGICDLRAMPGRKRSTNKRSAASKAEERLKRTQEEDADEEEVEEVLAPKRKRKTKKDDEATSPPSPAKVMRSVLLKGTAPVDEFCPVRDSCHVLQVGVHPEF